MNVTKHTFKTGESLVLFILCIIAQYQTLGFARSMMWLLAIIFLLRAITHRILEFVDTLEDWGVLEGKKKKDINER